MAEIIDINAAKAARLADAASKARVEEALRVALAGLVSRGLLEFHEAVEALDADHVRILDWMLNGNVAATLAYNAATREWRRGDASGTGVAAALASAGEGTAEHACLMACALIGQDLLSALALATRAVRADGPK